MLDITFIRHKADGRQCGLDLQRSGLPITESQNELDFFTGEPHPGSSLTGRDQTCPTEVHSLPERAAGVLQLLSKGKGRRKGWLSKPCFPGAQQSEEGEEARGSTLMDPVHSEGDSTRSNSRARVCSPQPHPDCSDYLKYTLKCFKTTISLKALDIFLSIRPFEEFCWAMLW